MINRKPTLTQLKKDLDTAMNLGAAMLACNGTMVIEGHEHLRLLIQTFQRPIVTHHEPAEVDYAGGLQSHSPSMPKTSFDSSITLIETDTGQIQEFAKIMMENGGSIPRIMIYDGYSDGSSVHDGGSYELRHSAITFGDGGGEIDTSSRSQILIVTATIKYHYFGDNAGSGINSNNKFSSVLQKAVDKFGQLTSNVNQNGGFGSYVI